MSRFVDPSTVDIIDRLSRSSIAQQEQERTESYVEVCSPATSDGKVICKPSDLEIQNDDTQSQPMAIRDRRWLGLVVHSLAIGILCVLLPGTVFPFLTNYLNMEGTQTLSARSLLAVPWVLKPVFGLWIQSCCHRWFMTLGWCVCAAALCGTFCISIPDPFFRDRSLVGKPLIALNDEQLKTIHMDAPTYGGLYVLLMSVATIGYVLADVAADGLVQEIAMVHFHEDPKHPTPTFTPWVTQYRYIAMLFGFLLLGSGMSGFDYGGDFDFTLSYNMLMLIGAIISFIPIPLIWTAIATKDHETPASTTPVPTVRSVWRLFEHRAINYVILCRFLGGICSGISATAVNPIAFYWAHVQPLNDNVVSFVALSAVLYGLTKAEKKGWNINYRQLIIGATIVVLGLDAITTFWCIWGVVRTQWLWIGLPVMEALPSGLDYVICNVLVGEISTELHHEALLVSIVTSVSFMANSCGLAVTKYLNTLFALSNQDIMRDTTNVRMDASWTFIMAYICQLMSLLWLLALPRSAIDARVWTMKINNHKATSTVRAIALVVLLLVCFAWTIGVHVLSINASTACLKMVGGYGCWYCLLRIHRTCIFLR